MGSRVFALVIGIDVYKSGDIWNLDSCVHDAKLVNQWLHSDLGVPYDHICLLLDQQATKRNIETNFVRHFLENAAIQRGDAILIYFAGHGSVISAPQGWSNDGIGPRNIEVLCPYDHDTKATEGRVAGVSDRSLHNLISDLSEAKGDNITLILDCCFTPLQSRSNIRDRGSTRWTSTTKAKVDDLRSGLWVGGRDRKVSSVNGFSDERIASHVVLAACRAGEKAVEGKNGGKFTAAFLEAATTSALHLTSYETLLRSINVKMGDGQHALGSIHHKSRLVFDAVPFTPDAQYVPIQLDNCIVRVEAGTIHGIVRGAELSIHSHNFGGPRNRAIATVLVLDVHPTWSACTPVGRFEHKHHSLKGCWAHVLTWQARHSFRSRLAKKCAAVLRSPCSLCRTPGPIMIDPDSSSNSIADSSMRPSIGATIVQMPDPGGAAIRSAAGAIILDTKSGTMGSTYDAVPLCAHWGTTAVNIPRFSSMAWSKG